MDTTAWNYYNRFTSNYISYLIILLLFHHLSVLVMKCIKLLHNSIPLAKGIQFCITKLISRIQFLPCHFLCCSNFASIITLSGAVSHIAHFYFTKNIIYTASKFIYPLWLRKLSATILKYFLETLMAGNLFYYSTWVAITQVQYLEMWVCPNNYLKYIAHHSKDFLVNTV